MKALVNVPAVTERIVRRDNAASGITMNAQIQVWQRLAQLLT